MVGVVKNPVRKYELICINECQQRPCYVTVIVNKFVCIIINKLLILHYFLIDYIMLTPTLTRRTKIETTEFNTGTEVRCG
jgi:hypothetical protein